VNHPRWARLIFVLYALLLLFGTHKPELRLDVGPIPRPDIFVHFTAFAIWTVLLTRCGFFGPWRSTRNLLLAGLVAAVYSAIDESTQAIPWINRQARIDDELANLGGVIIGMVAAAILARRGSADNSGRTLDQTEIHGDNHAQDQSTPRNGR